MTIPFRPRVLVLGLFTLAVAAAPGLAHARSAQDPSEGGDVFVDPSQQPVQDPVQDPSQQGSAEEGMEGEAEAPRRARNRSRSASRKGAVRKKAEAAEPAKKDEPAQADAAKTGEAAKPAEGGPSFARDVAPILAANCVGCHTGNGAGLRRGKLDMGSFEKLMKGGSSGEFAVAGKPEESHSVLRVKGEEEPAMPPGDDVRLGAPAIAALEGWVKAGAALDAGLDPKAPLKSYAASAQDLARSKNEKLSPEERDAQVKATALDRWKKTNPGLKPEMESTEHFALFSTLPKDRATAAAKTMENSLPAVRRALGTEATSWPEKVSFYVFTDRKDYVEFQRTINSREAGEDEDGYADLITPQPYVVVFDEDAATESAGPAPKRKPRGRRDAESADGNKRVLVGLLAENLAEGSVLAFASGVKPRWLAEGLGSYVGNIVERRPGHYQALRRIALRSYDRGWPTKATEVLGGTDQVSPEEFRGISFGLVECLTSPKYRELFPAFFKGITKGADKLDDVVKDVYGASRDEFLLATGEWIAAAYGGDEE